jgi:S-DNA-T family DNA segregation ATPase FtsK/SpoIIIE
MNFIRRRIQEIYGLALLALALYIVVALLDYYPSDPSFTVTSGAAVKNIAGRVGAYIASPILQFLGLAGGILPVLALFTWGWKLLHKSPTSLLWLRLSTLLVALIPASGLLHLIHHTESLAFPQGWGGYIGVFIANKMIAKLGVATFACGALALLLGALYVVLGLSIAEWKEVGLKLQEMYINLRERKNEMLRKPLPRRAPRISADEPEIEEHAIAVAPVKKAPRVSKPKQEKFDLRRPNEFELPDMELLNVAPKKSKGPQLSETSLMQNARMLEKVLQDFGVSGVITHVRPGPVVTLYELEPAPGTKASRVIGLSDDIARNMSAISARIAAVAGKNVIGIELPNSNRETVYLRELFETDEFKSDDLNLAIALGKDIGGEPIVVDLAKMPHLLVAGTTGSGKSVAINTMILSLLYKYTPEECKFIMVDPKMLELSVYDGIPHLLAPVVTEPGKAVVALKWTVKEMENRYRLMSNLGVRSVAGYNQMLEKAEKTGQELTRTVQTGFEVETGKPIFETVKLDTSPLPFIVVIVDEMADLMLVAGKDIEGSIQRLAQMARAAGIHLIMATQRPSVDVITGVIKANFPTRISFQVTSKIDSRTILGEQGAEQLLGQGDMLYMAGGGRITRVHGPFVSDQEVEKIANYLRSQGEPAYVENITVDEEEEAAFAGGGGSSGDDLYDQAVAAVVRDGKASTSYVQRVLKIGYNRAATMIERMEKEGVVSKPNHAGKREILARRDVA